MPNGLKTLPDFALFHRVHEGSGWALEIRGKVQLILKRPDDPITAGRVLVRKKELLEDLGPVHGAPYVRGADPKHLLRRVPVQAGQPGLRAALRGRPPAVRPVRQHDAPVVRDILVQRVQPVDMFAGHLEAVVLPDHATRPFLEFLASFRAPPVSHVAHLVVHAALVVETVRDFVPDHVPDTAVIHVIGPVSRKEHALQYACNNKPNVRFKSWY